MDLNYHDDMIRVENGNQRCYVNNPLYIPGCQQSRLIQRMKQPRDPSALGFDGNNTRSSFSKKGWDTLRAICTFEYMGAAEFETDALAKAFHAINEAKDLEAYTLEVKGHPEFPWYSRKMQAFESEALETIKKSHELSTTVFVLAPKKIRPHVELVIRRISHGDEVFLSERTKLRDTMFSTWYWTDETEDVWTRTRTQGWIEFDNGYMFFANEGMWRSFCELFLNKQPDTEIKVKQPDFTNVDDALKLCPISK